MPPFWQTTENGVPQASPKISIESLPSPARSAPTAVPRFAKPKLRMVDVVPPQPTLSNAGAAPRCAGDVLSGLPKSSHSAGGAGATPDGFTPPPPPRLWQRRAQLAEKTLTSSAARALSACGRLADDAIF